MGTWTREGDVIGLHLLGTLLDEAGVTEVRSAEGGGVVIDYGDEERGVDEIGVAGADVLEAFAELYGLVSL